LVRPMMASFRKSLCKFCPKLAHIQTRQYHYFVGCAPLIIYILHNNICLMCFKEFLCLLCLLCLYTNL
jgi:hypothetical protein